MANEELKEQIDLKKELLNLTQKIIDVDDDSRGILSWFTEKSQSLCKNKSQCTKGFIPQFSKYSI